ncbi:MAG: DUF4185 domain-containing protein [Desulfobacterales bacterium]|nr:DUF4185 domain-containing protein [Desulfobacterales bacterium]
MCMDGVCDPTEDCASCQSDCGACPICGDGVCNGEDDCTELPRRLRQLPADLVRRRRLHGHRGVPQLPRRLRQLRRHGPGGSAAIVSVEQVVQLTGEPSFNSTGAVNVYGTDLGSMFVHGDDRLYFLFGDTFGAPGHPTSSGDWRSNVAAWSTDLDPRDGITFGGWVADGAGRAPGPHRR